MPLAKSTYNSCWPYKFILSLVVTFLVGCAHQDSTIRPASRLLTAQYSSTTVVSNYQTFPLKVSAAAPQSSGSLNLSLAQAIEMALQQHPSLLAAELEIRARSAEYQQAGLLPNPELQADIDNFGGSGVQSGVGVSETTLSVGQLIELGSKRFRRQTLAAAETQLAAWDLEARRIEVYRDITQLYVSAVAADQKLSMTERLILLSEQVQLSVNERVRAGSVSPLENQRVQIVVARAYAERDAALAEKQAALRSLSATLSISPNVDIALSGQLQAVASPPPSSDLIGFLQDNPYVARWSAEIEAQEAKLDYEQALRVPDLTLGVGVKHSEETNDNALLATFSLPIPLFNRNQGSIEAARSRLAQSRAEAGSAQITLAQSFERAYAELAAAAVRSVSAQSHLLPSALAAFESTQIGYREGKFDLVTLLDAQRTYFEIVQESNVAIASYNLARAELEAIIGRNLTSIAHYDEEQ